jgi:demethylmenaquinone methyltransferase/2-methoxy-6-polyprenyl-1,4-benzoquinol methylase
MDVLPVLQTKDERRSFYDKIAGVYDLLADKSERPMREMGLNLLDAQAGEHILEIGFGTGHCLVELARTVGADGRVYGIDISPKMLQRANELLQDHGLDTRVELQEGDAEQLPYQTDSLDAIFMSFTLELFDTPEIPGLLSECKRVLKPDGRLGVVAISKEGERGMVVKAFEWTHRHFPNLMDCRPIYAQKSLEAAGFYIEEAKVEHMWVPVEIVLAHNRLA